MADVTAQAQPVPVAPELVSAPVRARLSWLWATLAHGALVAVAVLVVVRLGYAGNLAQAVSQWDTLWYIKIAIHGYPAAAAPSWAYFPLYPFTIVALDLIRLSPLISGLAVSLVGTMAFAYCLQRLSSLEFGPEGASWAPWLVLMSPFGAFFAFAYTEGLFFALAAGSLLCARRGRFGWAAVLAALATATRPTGIALAPALAVEALRQSGRRWDVLIPRLAWLGTVVVVADLMILWASFRTQHPLVMLTAETRYFGVHLAWPWTGLVTTVRAAFSAPFGPSTSPVGAIAWDFQQELIAAAVGLVLVGWACWKLRPAYSVFMTASFLLAISLNDWRSTGRYELALFPAAFLIVAVTRRAPWLRWILVVLGSASMAYGASMFARGMWLG